MNEAVKVAKYEAKARRDEALVKLGSQGLDLIEKLLDTTGKITVEAIKTPGVGMVAGVVLVNYFHNKNLIGDVDAALMRAVIVSTDFIQVFVPKLPDLSGLFGK